ncbi:glycosyltransferase family 9 protein [Parasalinivibrio latis]|uniref:glycosyltransferase family 9 protein n=1 Tax=Parasalinivibrio latis TaxID=2952610 RepID=UPI0030E24F6F
MALFSSAPHSLCFLRLSAIGDVCHAVAAIQAVQSQWPDTEITWIVGKVEAGLVGDLPGINVVTFDKKRGLDGMKAVWRELRDHRFDALVHMQVALRASILTLGIKARYRVGFNFSRAKEAQWLFTNKRIDDRESQHVLDSFFAFTRYLGVEETTPRWSIPLSADDCHFAQEIIAGKPSLVISPAASKDERNWLPERYAAVADYAEKRGLKVILCGSPAEREVKLADNIIRSAHSSIINLVGKTSLKQLTAIIKQATAVLAPDSGPAHIATTQGTPVIGLYGHSNPTRTGPYNSLDLVVSVYDKYAKLQHNRSADTLPWGTRVKGGDIMADITVPMVTDKLDTVISRMNNERVTS